MLFIFVVFASLSYVIGDFSLTEFVKHSKYAFKTAPKYDFSLVGASSDANIPASELSALQDFYDATNGPNWNTGCVFYDDIGICGVPWDFTTVDPNPCVDQWLGINCTSVEVNGFVHINGLALENANLVGTLTSSLSNLPDLTLLYLPYNNLWSSIPTSLYSMNNLTILDVTGNQITGTLSSSIGNLNHLEHFSVNYNQFFCGTIPDSLYNITTLKYLGLNMNQFEGTISPLINNLPNLETFYALGNKFGGTLPEGFLCKQSWNDIYLTGNQFTGSLPSCEDKIVPYLGILSFAYNKFEGTIPSYNGATFPGLFFFFLCFNQLTGTIPASLGDMLALQELELNNNKLIGTIPENVAALRNLSVLFLSHNSLHGTLPETLWYNYRLQQLDVSHNKLSGTLSSQVGNQTNLEFTPFNSRIITDLLLDNNQFTGTLPVTISQLMLVQTFFVNNNRFSGNLNGVFNASTMKLLINIDVSTNLLTGKIPEEPFKLKHLLSFAAGGNCLSGSLPEQICHAKQLSTLSLDGMVSADNCQHRFFPDWTNIKSYWTQHRIEGSIPTCLFTSMPDLSILHLSGNGFTGELPNLDVLNENLTDLSLSNNNFRGTIPDAFQLKSWSSNLDLSYNMLGGVLNQDFPYYGPNASLSLEVNRLSGEIPSSLVDVQHITILDSNLFDCSSNRDGLPTHDSDYEQYECGSNSVDAVLYTWLAIGAFCALFTIGVWSLSHNYYRSLRTKTVRYLTIFSVNDGNTSAELLEFGSFLRDLRAASNVLAAIIFVVMVVANATLSSQYNTYAHEYAWNVSSAFLSGVAPSIVLLLVISVLAVIEWMVFRLYVAKRKWRTVKSVNNGHTSWSFLEWVHLTLVVLFNLALMVGVNIAYVKINTNYSNAVVQVTQLAVSAFKVVWNHFIVRYIVVLRRRFNESKGLSSNSLDIAALIMLFNNIAAPFLAVAFISTSCFYNVVTTPPQVKVSYHYHTCNSYEDNGPSDDYCTEYVQSADIRYTSYTPPFDYGYECSSTFISVYATIYIIMLMIMTFVTPAIRVAAINIHKMTTKGSIINKIAYQLLPNIFKSGSFETPRDSLIGVVFARRLFDCEIFIVQLINIVAIILTFGVVFPPIAVLSCVTILSVSWFAQLFIGRYLTIINRGNGDSSMKSNLLDEDNEHTEGVRIKSTEIDRELKDAREMFMNSLWTIVPFAVLFYSFLLFDILGDAHGWMIALTIPIVIITVVSLLFGISMCCRCYYSISEGSNRRTFSNSDVVDGIRTSTLEFEDTTKHSLI